jgi:hypothetical protein
MILLYWPVSLFDWAMRWSCLSDVFVSALHCMRDSACWISNFGFWRKIHFTTTCFSTSLFPVEFSITSALKCSQNNIHYISTEIKRAKNFNTIISLWHPGNEDSTYPGKRKSWGVLHSLISLGGRVLNTWLGPWLARMQHPHRSSYRPNSTGSRIHKRCYTKSKKFPICSSSV